MIIDYAKLAETCQKFIKDEVEHSGMDGIVLGVSGGVDSAVVASLCCRAIGSDNVFGLILPYKTSAPESEMHARLLIDSLGMKYEKIDISILIDMYFEQRLFAADKISIGNKAARERMSILFDCARRRGALVAGTGNKTEAVLGYFTLFGDGAYSINPIGEFYKTEVWGLAKYLGVPDVIIDKKPSADLWPGQTDEDELGISYADADAILYKLLEDKLSPSEIMKSHDPKIVAGIIDRIGRTEFKRRMPRICAIQRR